tara:strand:+ start:26 stop:526 length:501 start_codon:yes stop_codon:yes gene_type:complete
MQSIRDTKINRVIVREAKENDKLDCLMLIKSFVKESNQPFKFDPNKTLESISNSIQDVSPLKLFVAELNSDIIGFVWAIVYEQLFSKDKTSDELAWYVDEKHRGGTAAIRLLKAYEDWASENNVVCMNMSHIDELKDLSKLYNKLGYKKIESTFQKETLRCRQVLG